MNNGSALVYFRPLNVAFVRVHGPYAMAARKAWRTVFAWLEASGMRRNVGCGWGLLLDDPKVVAPEKCRYDACIEIITGYEHQLGREFGLRRLPGGVFARRRLYGGAVELRHDFSLLCGDSMHGGKLVLDRQRPVVEIFFDDPDKVPEERRRVDICVPVLS